MALKLTDWLQFILAAGCSLLNILRNREEDTQRGCELFPFRLD